MTTSLIMVQPCHVLCSVTIMYHRILSEFASVMSHVILLCLTSTQFWRFLITAAKNNTEVKMWCTVKWKCLQTIRLVSLSCIISVIFMICSFAPPKAPLTPSEQAEPVMLLALDNSASFMLAADTKRMVCKRLCVCNHN